MIVNLEKKESYIGRRIFAGLIDYMIVFGFFIYFAKEYGVKDEEGVYTLSGLIALVPVLFWFVYTIITEQITGTTLRNLIINLKPKSLINDDKITLSQSLKRHLLDPVDLFLFGLVGLILIMNSKNNQRVGDAWANTIVVKDKK